jgi:hypothetical protein
MKTFGSARYHFKVSERADGTFWVSFESNGDELEILKDLILGVDLREGISRKQADEILAYMNKNLGQLHFYYLGSNSPETSPATGAKGLS